MQVRVASLFMISLLAVASAVGCQGVDTGEQGATSSPTPNGADDDDDDGSTPEVTPTNNPEPTPTQPVGGGSGNDAEPNDDHASANPLGTSTTISGDCGDLDISDIFSLTVSAGKTVSASVTWTESADDDLDLYVSSDDYGIDEGDESVPPGDSPAQASATFPTAQTVFVEVYCYYAYFPNTTYTGTVTVQ